MPQFLRSKLKMEARGFSETSFVIYRATLLHIREGCTFNNHYSENEGGQDFCVLSVGFYIEIKTSN